MSISIKPQGPVENRLLAALPDEVLARLLPHLQPVSFALGGVVYESSERMERLYFPTTCIVSLLYTMADGATAAIRQRWTPTCLRSRDDSARTLRLSNFRIQLN
jgi:hypothetical protein